jgi:glycosyltransferase involved in cell wall biosynthesis
MSSFRLDLHLHSKYSTRPSQWILQKLGCAESFSEPLKLYERARARGMSLVTITDHNTLAGSLDIAHLPGTFVSEEITTYFPEDRCKLHVLAYHITEAQHRDIQPLRENVFELAPYLRQQGIAHVLAHPLFAVNERLTPGHFEQCLLLFNSFELNGTRDALQNTVLREILSSLTPRDIDRLADKHGLTPWGERPWVKGLTGGSDDHSGLNAARMFTEFDGEARVENVLAGLAARSGRPMGQAATPLTMAHNIYSIAYQFYKSRAPLPAAAKSVPALGFADQALDPAEETPRESLLSRIQGFFSRRRTALYLRWVSGSQAHEVLLKEASALVSGDEGFQAVARGAVKDMALMEREWYRFVAKATDQVLSQFADRILKSVLRARLFDVFHTIGSAASLYALLAPYFVSYGLFSSERAFCDRCLEAFGRQPQRPRRAGLKIAHFTDTFREVNGVARTIRQQLRLVDQHGKHMRVLTCGQEADLAGAVNFEPVGAFEIPEYPELKLFYPPFLTMLAHCFEEDYDLILAATPGPVGLAALAIARILKVPFHGTYHTAFPQYVGALTQDAGLEDASWRYMLWFYNQMDVVYAPSRATVEELVARGIPESKVKTYPRGVDVGRFHPAKRNGFFKRYAAGPGLKLLYVGRVSREKDLHVLAEAFRKLRSLRRDLELIVVGDGPYLAEMKQALRGLPAVFTGVLDGEDLAAAYASSDIFVFPSATDTFGNVVLEAQASGLPVIVTDKGGPRENMVPDRTGLVVAAGDADALARAVLHLADSPERLSRMRENARQSMEHRTFDETFLQTWELYGSSVRAGAA